MKSRNRNLKFNVHKSSCLACIDVLSSIVNHHPYYFLSIQFFFRIKLRSLFYLFKFTIFLTPLVSEIFSCPYTWTTQFYGWCALHAVRPLQINSMFPIHRPHLVTTSSKYSIIPYSSIIFRLFLHTDRLSKSYLETVSAYVSAVLTSQHKLHVCHFCNLQRN